MPNDQNLTQVGRLAMRREGDKWVAYYALPGTMEGAIFLGSILMSIVEHRPKAKDAFMAIMKDAVGSILKERVGAQPTWTDAKPAPESERAGTA